MSFSLLVLATLAGSLLIGLVPTLVDAVRKPLEARLGLDAGRTEWFTRLFYLAWLPCMPAAGWLMDSWRGREILFFGLIGLSLGIAWLALARSVISLYLNALWLGLVYSAVTVSSVRLMTLAFFPDYIENYHLNIASLNLGFVAVGAGALAGPWLLKATQHWWGHRQGLLTISVGLLAPAALTACCDTSSFPKPTDNGPTWYDLGANPLVPIIAGVILLYFALENLLEYWPEAFLKEIDYRDRALHFGMVAFWLAFIGMRGVAAWWLYYYPDQGLALTIILLIASACFVGNLAGGLDMGNSTIGFLLVGACYGPILPGLLGIALDVHGAPIPWSALGALLALSGFDTLIVRPIMDVFTRNRNARSVMRVPTFLAFALVAPLLVLAFLRN